ncbi:hypothetical protein CCAX7_002040 [Capsulimonas corticalis]|uniref:Uncharacterized protein n=1 Tax=Capsulimonas corticalis TaxID=2219043 RepID=A0A402CRS0_9BACT|nr:hypothetical protein [Capsulimonas corticalis]BDI28153.1 hypothetical protein CCAX7_002040 [Capsulimonas corticalis]
MNRKPPISEAIKENGNIVGMGASVILSAVLLNPIPLLAGVVAEAAYLLFVPESRWYTDRLAQRAAAEALRQRRQRNMQILLQLPPETQERFARLEAIRRQIEGVTQQDTQMFGQMMRKLDYLLDKFLQFALKELEFRAYLQSLLSECRLSPPPLPNVRLTSGRERPASKDLLFPSSAAPGVVADIQRFYDGEIAQLQTAMSAEKDEGTRSVLARRLDILQRRRDHVGKIGAMLKNLDQQLQLLQDTFGLINDEVRARSPEQVTGEIDEVVLQTDVMTQTLEELVSLGQTG